MTAANGETITLTYTATIHKGFRCVDDEDHVYTSEDDLGPALYECGECGTIFNRDNSANNNHQCPQCNKFGSKLDAHSCPECEGAEVEEVDVIECSECGEFFADDDGEAFGRHIRSGNCQQ